MSNATKFLMTDETGQEIRDAVLKISSALRGDGLVYGFHIDPNESDPSAAVVYLADAIGMTPASMDFNADAFDYGSWGDAFFMPQPCMLKKDGTVDYYLNPNNYAQKLDGTAADISDSAGTGDNAMMEWGRNGKKIWMKISPDADSLGASVYISDHQVDSNFHAYPFINNQGVMVDHFYTAIYDGSVPEADAQTGTTASQVRRSLSGKKLTKTTSGTVEIAQAKLNNPDGGNMWDIETYGDRLLINMLLILMGKSLDTQSIFGRGIESGSEAQVTNYETGSLNDRGLFWGSNTSTNAVKVFGMENYWALQWRRTQGLINSKGTYLVKLTASQADGSTVDEYNTTGEGYINVGSCPAMSGSYIRKMRFTDKSMLPSVVTGGSSSQAYCDGSWSNNNQVNFALLGGDSNHGAICGAFACLVHSAVSIAGWHAGAALSCKPST